MLDAKTIDAIAEEIIAKMRAEGAAPAPEKPSRPQGDAAVPAQPPRPADAKFSLPDGEVLHTVGE